MKDLDLEHNATFTNGTPMTAQQATMQLMTQTHVVSANDSDFIDIVVREGTPQLAARVANRYVESLQKLRSNRRQTWRDGVTRALAAESARLGGEVEKAERAVSEFRRDHNMPIGAGSAEDYQQMNRIAVEEASAAAMNAATAQRSASAASAAQMRTVAGATSPVVDALQRQYDDLQRERSQLSVALGANHPDRQRVEAQLTQVSIASAQRSSPPSGRRTAPMPGASSSWQAARHGRRRRAPGSFRRGCPRLRRRPFATMRTMWICRCSIAAPRSPGRRI